MGRIYEVGETKATWSGNKTVFTYKASANNVAWIREIRIGSTDVDTNEQFEAYLLRNTLAGAGTATTVWSSAGTNLNRRSVNDSAALGTLSTFYTAEPTTYETAPKMGLAPSPSLSGYVYQGGIFVRPSEAWGCFMTTLGAAITCALSVVIEEE